MAALSLPLPGSPPLARPHSGSLSPEEPTMMRRNDNYWPVPGEEKNLDLDFVNSNARSSDSIVRHYIHDKRDSYPFQSVHSMWMAG